MSLKPGHKDPTPEEIRKGCLEIQATWTEQEERKRHVGHVRQEYEVPQKARIDDSCT